MSKIYIDYDNERKYYAYVYKNDKVHLTPLTKEEIMNVLRVMATSNYTKIQNTKNASEISYPNNLSIVIDNVKVFTKTGMHDLIFEKLLQEITSSELKNYKSKLPPQYIPKVNRKKRMPNKLQVLAGSLSFVAMISLASSFLNKDKAQDLTKEQIVNELQTNQKANQSELENLITYENNTPINSDQTLESQEIIEDESDAIKVELAFDDMTANGKLEQTIELCSPYLDEWIERYGLPKDLTYALVSQEYGLLDCSINSGGACGPMQLQVSSFHNDNAIEYCQIPVYENGQFTGEYDEFYIADARRLDDPRLEGKNYLVMQNLEDNFQIGCAIFRRCIDKYKNIFMAVDAYNKGLYAMSSVCSKDALEHYKNDFTDFSWTKLIPEAYGEQYGDKDYIWHVLRYLDTSARGVSNIEYFYQGEAIKVDLTNTNVYNNDLVR